MVDGDSDLNNKRHPTDTNTPPLSPNDPYKNSGARVGRLPLGARAAGGARLDAAQATAHGGG